MLARLLDRYGRRCLIAVAAGHAPPPFPFQMFVAAALPHLARHYTDGYRAGLAEVRAKRSRRRVAKRKGLGDAMTPLGWRGVVAALNPFAPAEPSAPGGLSVGFDVFDPRVTVAAERMALELAGDVAETTKERVRAELAEGLEKGESNRQLAKRLVPLFGKKRAAIIAGTESSRAHHAGQTESWKASGIERHQWVASSNACPNCLYLDGQVEEIGVPFVVKSSGRAAYRAIYHPPAHPACVCATAPVVE